MSEVFTHKFGGFFAAEARRWKNPDGSEGGVVATSAIIASQITIPFDSVVWPASRIGDGASIEASDWIYVSGPQGSRNAFATVVHSGAHGLRWWVGCQHGLTTDQLRERVEREHGASAHGDDYRHLIQTVLTHPGLERHRARFAAKIVEATS